MGEEHAGLKTEELALLESVTGSWKKQGVYFTQLFSFS